jgi:hypothetical protein
MKLVFTLFLGFLYTIATAQQNQSIQIKVYDATSFSPLKSCEVVIYPGDLKYYTDSTGNVESSVIQPGRYHVVIYKEGYKPLISDHFIHSSNSSSQFTYYLKDGSLHLTELEVKASSLLASNEAQNEFSYLSSRSFTAEETERIPMGLNDPARMAQSYAGVQGGRNDLENQIIIRGNSPFGVSWRIEGIDIPNPNHFAKHGSAGGGVTIFSSQLIGKSDFYSGAMPAEFGNALAGSFDIYLRKGNLNQNAFKARASMIGIDIATEGPIKKGRSSYVVNYRYSTLGLMNWLSFYLVNNRTVNTFSDISFNMVFNSKNAKNITTIFGVGGKSLDRAFPEPNPEKRKPGVVDDWEERIRPAEMGVVGLTHTRQINKNSSIKLVIAWAASNITRASDTLSATNERFRFNKETYLDKRVNTSVAYNLRFSSTLKLKVGTQLQFLDFLFNRETFPRIALFDLNALQNGKLIWANGEGRTQIAETYALVQKTVKNKFYLNVGFHFMHFFFNKTGSFEPRIAAKYSPNKSNILSFSYGRHSQLLPLSTYFVAKRGVDNENDKYPNQNLDFPFSDHFVLSYRKLVAKNLKLTFETYYQLISRSLVQTNTLSSFWILNAADGYPGITDLEASGKGFNKGVDLTIEKLFYHKYFVLFTGSIFDAKYRTFAGDIFNSSFDDSFGGTLTTGREFELKKNKVVQVGLRGILNGGFRYTPADIEQSSLLGFYVPRYSETNKLQAPSYKRIDARIAYRFNGKKTSGQISLDVQNLTGYENYSRAFYNVSTQNIELQRRGTGFTPILSVAVEF